MGLIDDVKSIVFSTYVEVILLTGFKKFFSTSILHVCGGDPAIGALSGASFAYSPRMWR